MNKKAFTLIELLGVIIILSLLAVLASTAITKLVKDAKNTLSDTQMKSIETAAKQWGAEHPDKLTEVGTCKYITLKDLQGLGYIGTDIVDPKTKEKLGEDINIKINITSAKYGALVINYEVNPDSIEGCTPAIQRICTLTDNDSNSIPSVNDVITCDTESFTIINNEEENIDTSFVLTIANKNIEVTLDNPKQSDEAGGISFANTNYWWDTENNQILPKYSSGYVFDENSNLYPYIIAYKNYLISLGLDNVEVRLLNAYDEYHSTNSQNYWWGAIWKRSPSDHILANYTSELYTNEYGIRPVVEIKKINIDY